MRSVVDVEWRNEVGRESVAFLFTLEAEEGGPLPRDTSLTHVTFLNGELVNCMPHDHKGLSLQATLATANKTATIPKPRKRNRYRLPHLAKR